MDVRTALIEQYRAGLAMLRQCIEACPDDQWNSPCPRCDEGDKVIFRPFWRIAFHAAYFTHLYMGQTVADFVPWPDRGDDFPEMWREPWGVEPFELPEDARIYSKGELLGYVYYVDSLVTQTVHGMDLDTEESGIPWYRNISKFSHQILNIRHLQGHVGQLSELLMRRGIDIDWISAVPPR